MIIAEQEHNMPDILKNYTMAFEITKVARLEKMVDKIKKRVPASKKSGVNKSVLTRLAVDNLLELPEDEIIKRLEKIL